MTQNTILTVTLNPAIDKTCTMGKLEPGQVNRLDSAVSYPGGKGINVTRILRAFGANVRCVGFVGGITGEFIEKETAKTGAVCSFTHINDNTRINTNILAGDGMVTEILEKSPCISKAEQNEFINSYEEMLGDVGLVVISGSLPDSLEPDFYYNLVDTAKKRNIRVILDSSGEAYKKAIEAKPFMIKPNINELEKLLGEKPETEEKITDACKRFTDSGLENVIVSRGEKGFIYVSAKEVFTVEAPKTTMVSTVGCGDALVAAYAYSVINQYDIEKTLRLCLGTSVANGLCEENGRVCMDKINPIGEAAVIRGGGKI